MVDEEPQEPEHEQHGKVAERGQLLPGGQGVDQEDRGGDEKAQQRELPGAEAAQPDADRGECRGPESEGDADSGHDPRGTLEIHFRTIAESMPPVREGCCAQGCAQQSGAARPPRVRRKAAGSSLPRCSFMSYYSFAWQESIGVSSFSQH